MKTKTIILLLMVFLYSSVLKAQEFKGGILLGFCASQMDGDKLKGFNKFGPTAGIFVNRKFTEKWGGQFEIRYNQKGAANVKAEETYKVRLNYVEIPFLASYNFTKYLKCELGLVPSILISSKALIVTYDTYPKMQTFDLPIAFGLNYSLTKKIDVNIRYSYSTFPVSGYYNNAFNFVLYYYIK